MERIEPWGQRREDWRAALLAHTIVRCHAAAGDGKVFGSESEIGDFLLRFAPREEESDQQTPEQMLAVMKRLAAVQAARGV